ncbi:vanadium-dependent haloperoxidase [Verrucosispora sp. WMMA2044]|uniref:vanadium-dependent haloperoxidase n=1 Tax=Verrucosispora sp. WMMA2044 TaxID=3016419 RepID=UPI00248C1205|nr:vanadium-dependent haloperoxidase [Verrucosispora sp. WMMA2044]WBB50430.1 vanadium-dependent haloperoxidase [Verrucosispora sp. WMMA2044]
MSGPKRPWRWHLRSWGAVAAAVVLAVTLVPTTAVSQQKAAGFDFDNGNALTEVIYPRFQKAVRSVTPGGDDATLVADHILMVEVAWFDAIAPYHSTAVGIYSNLGRQPRSEATTRNRNIAVIYAAYTSLNALFPEFRSEFRTMLESVGLDPDDPAEDVSRPADIGVRASKAVLEARKDDGSNRDGDAGGRKYNLQPYADYTGYQPVNTSTKLRNPSRWQPLIRNSNGIRRAQEFVTPHWGRVKPVSYRTPAEFRVVPPVASNHRNRLAYKRQADEVLRASANLTDRQKMTAEFFNDKIYSLGRIAGTAAFQQGNFDIEKAVHYVTTVDLAIFDVSVATWYFKRKFDAVRPVTAIRYLYGNKELTAWGGPGRGTVDDITGNEWRSYLQTADHTEYPSGSSSFCLAYAQAARRFLGTDQLVMTVPLDKGSSKIEPGITPASDMTLRWENLTDMAQDCSQSRLWGGVHFRASTENAEQYAPKVGDSVYEFVQRKINGR